MRDQIRSEDGDKTQETEAQLNTIATTQSRYDSYDFKLCDGIDANSLPLLESLVLNCGLIHVPATCLAASIIARSGICAT